MLLKAGADPWARGSYPFDAPLQAVCSGRHSILTRIAASNHPSPHWDQTWVAKFGEKLLTGGNALHLAATTLDTRSLELYISHGLLSELECRDNGLQTPMHYAAWSGHPTTITWLQARGGNIDARDRYGWTPLHFAVDRGHLEAAKTLLNLGATQKACNQGCVPLALAYSRGNAEMIEALQRSDEALRESSTLVSSRRNLNLLAKAMYNAIRNGDLGACEKIHSLGCPIDVEMDDGERMTPLAVAIYNKNPKIVQWLVDSGAMVSTVFPQRYRKKYSTALEVAGADPSMNSILTKLLDKYLDEGASFLDTDSSPLHFAVGHHNLEGLKTLLNWLRGRYESPNAKAYVAKASPL